MTTQYIKLNNVRLSFPFVLKTRPCEPGETPQYDATFILDKVKHATEIKAINARIDAILKAEGLDRTKVKSDRLGLKDGDMQHRPEYQGAYYITGKSYIRVPLIHRDAVTPVTNENNPFFGGCYVNACIDLAFYRNKSTGIKVYLKSMQFRKEGESFGQMPQDITGVYEPIKDEDEDGDFNNIPDFM